MTYLDVSNAGANHGTARKRPSIKSCPELYVGWPGQVQHAGTSNEDHLEQSFRHALDFCILEMPPTSNCDQSKNDFQLYWPSLHQRRLSSHSKYISQSSLKVLPCSGIAKTMDTKWVCFTVVYWSLPKTYISSIVTYLVDVSPWVKLE